MGEREIEIIYLVEEKELLAKMCKGVCVGRGGGGGGGEEKKKRGGGGSAMSEKIANIE